MFEDYEVPVPGFFIQEELDARGWSQRDLAFILGIEETALNKIIKGKTGISLEMSKALAEAFEVDNDFFANLQKAYDLAHSAAPDPAIARRASLQAKYPVREMIKRGWLENMEIGLLEVQLQRFFKPVLHAAKKTNSGEDATPTQLAWLHRVIQIAESMNCKPYSEKAFHASKATLKKLMTEPEHIRRVPSLLAECGLRFVIVEGLPNAKIDGVSLWLDSNTPVIGLSLRYDRIDNFWFVFWHECAHILHRHGHNAPPILDVELEGDRAADSEINSAQERVANRDAAEMCISQHEMISFMAKRYPFFSERDVVSFAATMHVHPGIIIGQIQSRTKRWNLLRKYLVKVRQYLLGSTAVDGWGQVAPVSI
ncbi:MAG TPA: helix-turn-helix domain-containing protein [Xanthobacteraceae bacterium]|jgi:HTH-type transcriptional regulator/antitoxin HigA|nr:helix-turn-helix domain-containing protein [Xanthobacteraceae bacterium]